MKNIFLCTAFLILSVSSFAQKIRFTDSTNQWKSYFYDCYHNGAPVVPNTDSYTGDTIILGMAYKNLTHDKAFIREDSIANKVFARLPGDTIEHLLYDYTLNVGDTFKIYDNSGHNWGAYYVSTKDSVLINAIWYKTWHFLYAYSIYVTVADYYVIEGIGCLVEPIAPLDQPEEECAALTCFNHEGTTPLVAPMVGGYFDNATSCSLTFLSGINSVNDKNQTASVIPNPINETSKITFSYTIPSGSITVFNDIGQTIINTTFQNKEAVLIGDRINTPGIYFYRVTDNQSGKAFSGKFVY